MDILNFSNGFYLDNRFGNIIQPKSKFFSIIEEKGIYLLNINGKELNRLNYPIFEKEMELFNGAIERINYFKDDKCPLIIDVDTKSDKIYVSGIVFEDSDFIKNWFNALFFASSIGKKIEMTSWCELKYMDLMDNYKKGFIVNKDGTFYLSSDNENNPNSIYMYLNIDEDNVPFDEYCKRYL